MFQPPKFDWHSDDQQTAFKEWQGNMTLTLEASDIPPERWYASIIGFLDTEGFKHWQHLDISKKPEDRKSPDKVFKAIANTLEVSMYISSTTLMKCTATFDRENKKPPINLTNVSKS